MLKYLHRLSLVILLAATTNIGYAAFPLQLGNPSLHHQRRHTTLKRHSQNAAYRSYCTGLRKSYSGPQSPKNIKPRGRALYRWPAQ